MTKEQTRKLMSVLVDIVMLYQQALKSDGILNPLAWAVYQVWKRSIKEKGRASKCIINYRLQANR